MTIKGQNISNFKLLLSAPTFLEKIPVSVKYCAYFIPVEHSPAICDGYYRNNWYNNTNIHSKYFNFAQIVLKHYILLWCWSNYSVKFRGSGGILTEPRLAPELAPVPGSEQWTLVSSDPGLAWPEFVNIIDNIATISVTTLLLLEPTTKIHQHFVKKAPLFTRAGRPRGIPAVGAGANILHSPTSILLCT